MIRVAVLAGLLTVVCKPAWATSQTCHASNSPARIPAGFVLLGEDGPDRPGQRIYVPAFHMDRHEVTNEQFTRFVQATGYRTQAERGGGGAVFVAPPVPVLLDDPRKWWRFVRGADWRHPRGRDTGIAGRDNEPVVQVTLADAKAYARWAGGFLPSERQWERAARGRQASTRDPGSWAFSPEDVPKANIHTGHFPDKDDGADGHAGLASVGCFKPNDFGVYDMVGNAWEWVSGEKGGIGRVKGGSFLCSARYCANFRPAAFQAQEDDLPTSHIGFRVSYLP